MKRAWFHNPAIAAEGRGRGRGRTFSVDHDYGHDHGHGHGNTPRGLSRLGARLDRGKRCHSKGLYCFASLGAGLGWLPLAALLALAGGSVRAEDHPTLTEPVSGSFDHEPSHTGVAPAAGEPAAEPSTGHGEPGEHAGVDAKTLALQLLNFGVLLFLLIYFGGRALNKAFRSRHEQLKADIESAASQRALAEQHFREQDARLANLEQELAALRAAVHEEGERERARLLAGAEEKARRIQDETRFQLDQQVKEAELRLRAEVAGTAVKLADELLRRSVSPDDERRLTQDFAAGAGAPTEVVR